MGKARREAPRRSGYWPTPLRIPRGIRESWLEWKLRRLVPGPRLVCRHGDLQDSASVPACYQRLLVLLRCRGEGFNHGCAAHNLALVNRQLVPLPCEDVSPGLAEEDARRVTGDDLARRKERMTSP